MRLSQRHTPYSINPSHLSISVCVFLLLLLGNILVNCISSYVAKQRHGKHVPESTNTRNNRRNIWSDVFCAIRALWKESLLVWVCIHLSLLGNKSAKEVPETGMNCWRRRFVLGQRRSKDKQAINSFQNFLFIQNSRLLLIFSLFLIEFYFSCFSEWDVII
jgi:hypothetical protein